MIQDKTHDLECTNDECGHVGRPFIKMGGLICAKCRIILKTPDTVEYHKYLKEMRDKIGKST